MLTPGPAPRRVADPTVIEKPVMEMRDTAVATLDDSRAPSVTEMLHPLHSPAFKCTAVFDEL